MENIRTKRISKEEMHEYKDVVMCPRCFDRMVFVYVVCDCLDLFSKDLTRI